MLLWARIGRTGCPCKDCQPDCLVVPRNKRRRQQNPHPQLAVKLCFLVPLESNMLCCRWSPTCQRSTAAGRPSLCAAGSRSHSPRFLPFFHSTQVVSLRSTSLTACANARPWLGVSSSSLYTRPSSATACSHTTADVAGEVKNEGVEVAGGSGWQGRATGQTPRVNQSDAGLNPPAQQPTAHNNACTMRSEKAGHVHVPQTMNNDNPG